MNTYKKILIWLCILTFSSLNIVSAKEIQLDETPIKKIIASEIIKINKIYDTKDWSEKFISRSSICNIEKNRSYKILSENLWYKQLKYNYCQSSWLYSDNVKYWYIQLLKPELYNVWLLKQLLELSIFRKSYDDYYRYEWLILKDKNVSKIDFDENWLRLQVSDVLWISKNNVNNYIEVKKAKDRLDTISKLIDTLSSKLRDNNVDNLKDIENVKKVVMDKSYNSLTKYMKWLHNTWIMNKMDSLYALKDNQIIYFVKDGYENKKFFDELFAYSKDISNTSNNTVWKNITINTFDVYKYSSSSIVSKLKKYDTVIDIDKLYFWKLFTSFDVTNNIVVVHYTIDNKWKKIYSKVILVIK